MLDGKPDVVSLFPKQLLRCSDPQEDVPSSGAFACSLIGLYFSASWCPPCKDFAAILARGYGEIRQLHGAGAFEIIHISLDAHEADFGRHTEAMPWLAVPFSQRTAVINIFMHFQVREAPRLIIIDNAGEVISRNARGGRGFGFGCDPLAAFKFFEDLAAAAKQTVKEENEKEEEVRKTSKKKTGRR